MWNDSYDIMPDELSQIMELCRHGSWICTRFEPEDTLCILFCKVGDGENVIDKRKFEFTKC